MHKTVSRTYASWSARWSLRAAAALALLLVLAPSVTLPAGPPDVTLLFTSDTRGMLRRCGCAEGQLGGVSARASYIKQVKGEGPTLVLDAGDTLFEELKLPADMREFYSIKADYIFKAMMQAGYDAVAVGEYDLAYGWEFLRDAAEGSRVPLVAANISSRADGTTFTPFRARVFECMPGIRVGVTAVLDQGFPYKSFPASFHGLDVTDPLKAARAELTSFGDKIDLAVVLTHFSVGSVEDFVRSLGGAHVVIQGHSQEMLEEPVKIGDTILVKGFNKAKQIGRLDLWFTRGEGGGVKGGGAKEEKGALVADYKYAVITLDDSIPPDPGVEGVIASYRERLKERSFVFAAPDPVGEGGYQGEGRCAGCHDKEHAEWSGTAHAHALAGLDKTGDQYDPECLPCHTTGYGYKSGYRLDKKQPGLENVTCEACHGRGGGHPGGDGHVVKSVDEHVCRGCHDEENSPHFDYEEYLGRGGDHRVLGE